TVRDVDNRDAFRLQALDDRKQSLDFWRRQCRRRLVQYQQFAVITERLGDLDQLHLRNAQLRNRHTWIDSQPHLCQQFLRTPVQHGSIQDAKTPRQALQHQVFGNGKMRQQVEFLMNDTNTLNLCIMWSLWFIGLG